MSSFGRNIKILGSTAAALFGGISSKSLLPSPVLKEKCPVLKNAPNQQTMLGIVHHLQYPLVILLPQVLTIGGVLQWLLSHQGSREPFEGCGRCTDELFHA